MSLTDAAGNPDPRPAVHGWTVTGGCATGGTVTVEGGQQVRQQRGVLVRFALPQVPAGCSVTSATLKMYASSHKSGRTLQALQVTSARVKGADNPPQLVVTFG